MTIKLEIEIKDDKVIYSWELGASKQNGELVAHAEYYLNVCNFIKTFNDTHKQVNDHRMNELLARTFIAEDTGRAQKMVNEIKASEK
jgi:hypothetical protein